MTLPDCDCRLSGGMRGLKHWKLSANSGTKGKNTIGLLAKVARHEED